jgi:heme/copper-type cytochrome/quinol oxidase subunit 2
MGLVLVIAFWIVVFGLVMFLVRWVARANDDEQTVCDISDDSYTPAHTSSNSPAAPAT